MPNFNSYRQRMGSSVGSQHTIESQMIIDSTWYDDPAHCVGYLYDYYHDDETDKHMDLHPEKSKTKIPVDLKYILQQYQTFNKDAVDYRIQFKTSEDLDNLVPYYKQMFVDKCDATFPIGLYVDLPDERGKYNRWLICSNGNKYNRDFPEYSVLRASHKYQWIKDGKRYEMWGVPRSQNS